MEGDSLVFSIGCLLSLQPVSGVGFLYSASLWFLFIVEILPSGWGWTIGLSRFPG